MSANPDFVPRLPRCACLSSDNIGELACDLRTHGGKNGKRKRNDGNKNMTDSNRPNGGKTSLRSYYFYSLGVVNTRDTFN